ncbi:probable disease resistance protein At5g63020 [Euphorbia lathyris]|uniref:probable disease resistance protein At5g63020 n=1 Tax=Euphorbia lathyris TaxID=212925 RepID=UPI0033140485
MGNFISFSLDNLLICCYDRAKGDMMYIWEFKDNLKNLKVSRDELRASKNDVKQRVDNQEGPQTKRLQVVEQWLKSVEEKLTEADELISHGEEDIAKKSCFGGGCCRHNFYSLGKSFVDRKEELDLLMQRGQQFDKLVEEVLLEPKYISQLKKDLKDLEVAKDELEATNKDVLRKVMSQEGGKMKRLERVEAWMLQVKKLVTGVDELLKNAPEDFSDPRFGKRVSDTLEDVRRLRSEGDFQVVVEAVESVYLSRLQDNIESLRTAALSLSGLKDDVMLKVRSEEEIQQKKRLKQVEAWRKNAERILAAADYLLNVEAPAEIKKLNLGDSSSLIGERVEKMLKDVIDHTKKGRFSEVTTTALPEPVVEIECDQTVGLQTKLDDVWTTLMNPEVGILGLYGIGGVGKTTLLTHINNKFISTQNDFDFVIWIVISKTFSLAKVQEEIGERIGIAVNDWKKKDVREKAKDISNLLRKKKFILLLDDLWEKILLEKAGVPIPNKRNGSKIVLTTRSEVVCSVMNARNRIKVETLPPDEAWILFEENVGKDTLSADPAIRPLAVMVARECAGLPLALIVVARAMACSKTPEEWKYALEDLQQSASDLEGIKDEVFARLKLSYDRLPDNKQRSCFIYCALFPEDFQIYKDDLIDYWISENFDDEHKDGEHFTRAKAYRILRHLVSVCLLEEKGKHVKMHDVIRDMALWISCDLEKAKYNFLVQAGKQLTKAPDIEIWKGVKRTSLMENSIRYLPRVSMSLDLQTLLLCGNPRLHEIDGSIFSFSSALTVLNLSNTRVKALPVGVTALHSLQYLNLSHTWIEELPRDLKELTGLLYLNVEHNDLLGMIPKGVISNFLSLQVLKMFRCGFFYDGSDDNILLDTKVQIEEIQKLVHLNVLSITIRSADALLLYFTTENVQSCTQGLSIECLGDLNSIQFSPTENMDQLETLQISASEHLEQITFKPMLFNSLREVVIEYCPRLLNLNWLVWAPNLAVLKVVVCEKIVEIVSDVDENLTTFSKLEVLELEGLPQLENICHEGLMLRAIKRMRVVDCPMLKTVPLNAEIIKIRKIIVEGEKDWWDILEWEDEDTKDVFQSSFRSYPPRTRIRLAAHHYFDIWSSMYS